MVPNIRPPHAHAHEESAWNIPVLHLVKDVETDRTLREDTLTGNMEISHMDAEKYLGQIISADGKNTKNNTQIFKS